MTDPKRTDYISGWARNAPSSEPEQDAFEAVEIAMQARPDLIKKLRERFPGHAPELNPSMGMDMMLAQNASLAYHKGTQDVIRFVEELANPKRTDADVHNPEGSED